jgi:osmotically-inducible protein OsmY
VRSDERIREDVCEQLCNDDEVDASEMTVFVKAGEVLLEGFASDRYSKHRAESIAESVNGVREVINHLRVVRGP